MADYYLDLSEISLDQFFETLTDGAISPGRVILLEHKTERLSVLQQAGIRTLKDLADGLKTKKRIQEFVETTGLSSDYLTILRRQALSYLPKPVALRDFPGVSSAVVDRLAEEGVVHGKHLFGRCPSDSDVEALSERIGAPPAELRDLRILVDLTRITGVGPVFARFFRDIGIEGLDDLAAREPETVYDLLTSATDAYTGPKATRWDVEQCIRSAAALSRQDRRAADV